MGRNIVPKQRKPRYCPFCGGLMVKAGIDRVSRKQLWLCHECKRRTVRPCMAIENK